MIFAAGLGTRLKPFTDYHPKALAPIAGEPILGRVITKLKNAGINYFVVNVHHFSQQIIDYLEANNNFGVTIQISDETDKLLETGGGILAARQLLEDDDFIVHNADILTDFDIESMIKCHNQSHADVTLLADKRDTRRYLVFDRTTNLMHGWIDRSTDYVRPNSLTITPDMELLAFGGLHIVSPKILPLLDCYAKNNFGEDKKPKFSIIDFYIDSCDKISISAFSPSSEYKWFDIGKPESLATAEREYFTTKI